MIAVAVITITYIFLFYLTVQRKIDTVIELVLLILWLDYVPSIITMFGEELVTYQYIYLETLWVMFLIYLLSKLSIKKEKKNIYLIIFSSYIIFNNIFNFLGIDTIRYLLNNLLYLFLYYKIFQRIEKENIIAILIKYSVKAVIIAILFVTLSTSLDKNISFGQSGLRYTAFIGPAKFASRLFFLLVTMLVLYSRFDLINKLRYSKKFYFILLSFAVFLLLLTQTRISIFAFFFAFVFFLLRYYKSKLVFSTAIIVLFSISMLGILNITTRTDYSKQFNIISKFSFSGISNIYSFTSSMRGTEYDKESSGRFYLWNMVLMQFGQTGFLGNGGNFGKNYFVTSGSEGMSFVDDMIYNSNYHNDPFRFYLEYGFIGLFLFLGFYFLMLKKTFNWKLETNINKSIIKNILFLFLLGGLFIMMFDNFYETHKYMFFAFFGIFTSLERSSPNYERK